MNANTPPETESFDAAELGAMMREMRENLGHDLETVARDLRIRLVYLEAIESGRLNDLPGNAYVSGFLRSYSDFLGLEGDEIVRRFKMAGADISNQPQLHLPSPVEEGRLPTGSILVVAAVIAAAAYGGWYYLSSAGNGPMETVANLPKELSGLVDGAKNQTTPKEVAQESAPATSAASTSEPEQTAAPAQPALTPQASEPQTTESTVAAASPETPVEAPQPQAPVLTRPSEPATPSATPETPENTTAPATTAATAPRTPAEPVSAPAAPASEPAPERTATAPSSETATPPSPQEPERIETPAVAETPTPAATPVTPATPAPAEPAATPTPAEPTRTAAVSAPAAPATTPAETPGEGQGGVRIVVRATADSYVAVRTSENEPLFSQLMRPGDSYEVPSGADLVLETGNAGGLQITVGGKRAPSLGPVGQIRRNIPLDAEKLLRGLN